MMNPATVKARVNNDLSQPPILGMKAERHNHLTELRIKGLDALERLDTKYQAILNDRLRSPEGQRDAIAKLANDFISAFAFLERVIARLDKDIADTPIFTVRSPIADPVLKEMRNHEIRDGLRGLNQNERTTQFIRAAEQDLDEMLDAMLTSPTGPLVGADEKDGALEARAKRKNPTGYEQWQQDVLMRVHVNALLEHCVLCLVSLGADPQRVAKDLGVVLHDVIEEQKRAAKRLRETANLLPT